MVKRSGFARPDAISFYSRRGPLDGPEKCHFGDCTEHCFAGLPVCFMCALMVGRFMHDIFKAEREIPADQSAMSEEHYWQLGDFVEETASPPAPECADKVAPPKKPVAPESVVYYLMLSPVTVKIGTTKNLKQRITGLRSELQYIVALEPGGFGLERERHAQFKAERRYVRREDFELSDALKRHIDSLAPMRDEMLARAFGSTHTPR